VNVAPCPRQGPERSHPQACGREGSGHLASHQTATGKWLRKSAHHRRWLDAQGIPTTRGKGMWKAAQVARVLARGVS